MMTDREKHLSSAIDQLTALRDDLEEWRRDVYGIAPICRWEKQVKQITAEVAAAALPKPSMIRRWFGRREAA